MSRSTNFACRRSRLALLLVIYFLAWAAPVATVFAVDNSPAHDHATKTGDLTGLSLQELYDLDIVQPNVLGGHTHPPGQTTFGYQYMHMSMSGIFQGSREISPSQAFAEGFSTVHTSMEMGMHMVEAMYVPTERLTLMAMLPYKSMSMVHETKAGKTFSQSADGIGDLEVMGMITIFGDIRKGGHRLISIRGAVKSG